VEGEQLRKRSLEEDEPLHPRARSLQDIYNSIDEVHVVCFLANSEDLSFEEVV